MSTRFSLLCLCVTGIIFSLDHLHLVQASSGAAPFGGLAPALSLDALRSMRLNFAMERAAFPNETDERCTRISTSGSCTSTTSQSLGRFDVRLPKLYDELMNDTTVLANDKYQVAGFLTNPFMLSFL